MLAFAVSCICASVLEARPRLTQPKDRKRVDVHQRQTFEWRGKGRRFRVIFSRSNKPFEDELVLPSKGTITEKSWTPTVEEWLQILRLASRGRHRLFWLVEKVKSGVRSAPFKLRFRKYLALMSTRSAFYDAGSLAVAETNSPWRSYPNLRDTLFSDHIVDSYGKWAFEILRYNLDSIIKYDKRNIGPDGVIWQFSTKDSPDDPTSNPHDLGFLSQTKAYLTRYGSTTLWIVDPSAESEQNFKKGEVDLSPLADADGIPEMSNILVLPEKKRAFILCQRLDRNNNWVPQGAYIAVINTRKDRLIQPDGKPGIELQGKNPTAIVYLPAMDRLFVLCTGKFPGFGSPAEYSGGIEVVNPNTLTSEGILVDDGDDSALYGGNFFGGLAVFSQNLAAFGVYVGWGDNRVLTFNPTTGEVYGVLGDLEGFGMDFIARGPFGHLWVSDAVNSQILLYDPSTGERVAQMNTGLIPNAITFFRKR